MFAGLMRYFMPPVQDDGWAARANGEAGAVGGALFLAAVIAVPLGVPVIFMLAGSGTTLASLLADDAFRAGLLMQAIGRRVVVRGAVSRAAHAHARGAAPQAPVRPGLPALGGRAHGHVHRHCLPVRTFAPLVFVAVYAGVSIVIDIAPRNSCGAAGRRARSPPACGDFRQASQAQALISFTRRPFTCSR
jgi:hypothetical protein